MFIVIYNPFLFSKVYCYSDTLYNVNDAVIVEDEERECFYAVVVGKTPFLPAKYSEPIKNILRKATAEDENLHKEGLSRSQEALAYCKQEIRNQDLPMKLIAVEMLLNMSKLIFYFTSPERVDFRKLVKVLVEQYRERIELRQIGVRNEVQLLGGIGSCGRNCCCTTFLKSCTPVSVKKAKESNTSINPTKMSGLCGRLSCCLPYEANK